MSELALQRIREAKEQRLTRLDLGNCGLTEIPDEVSELVWLEKLSLSGNKDLSDLVPLTNLTQLQLLDVSKTQVSDLTSLINLTQLQQLYVSETQVSDLTPLTNLTQLQQLYVSETQVSDLTPLTNLTQLQFLDASSIQVSDLSPLIQLTALKQLSVDSTQVSDLSPLAHLTALQLLHVHNTQVSDLSPLIQLTALKHLSVESTKVIDISPLTHLTTLQQLFISNTQVIDIRPLAHLTALQQLFVHSTQVSDLSPLTHLTALQQLFAYDTQVSDLSPLTHLTALQRLYLDGTQVSDLTPLTRLIEKGVSVKWGFYDGEDGIFVKNCPLTNPPQEIVEQGNAAILSYWQQIATQGSSEDINETKLLIVGEGGTGKTTLFEKLKNPHHNPLTHPTSETIGINILEGLPITADFRANLWDFGGQELQYMTHQFFLTPRALYVLMMDARKGSPNLAYWFKIISLLGRDSDSEKAQVLLVFNKRTGTTGTPQYEDLLKHYAADFDYKFLEVDFAVNNPEWDLLKYHIEIRLQKLAIKMPPQWLPIRETLREEAKTQPHITMQAFSKICTQHKVPHEQDQLYGIKALHKLGQVLYFDEKGLRSHLILSPKWAVTGIYTFLDEAGIKERNGHFTEAEFVKILSNKAVDNRPYSQADADLILQLMTRDHFDICYKSKNGDYIAAQLLPDNSPTPQYKWYPEVAQGGALQFRYQYPTMPKGLISRLIVRLSDHIEVVDKVEIVWKKGAILCFKKDGQICRVLIREDDDESKTGLRQIIIEVMGEPSYRKFALQKVRDEVEDLHNRWFRNIHADEIVPCCCKECRVAKEPKSYSLKDLLELWQKKELKQCITGEDVHIRHLLEGVYAKEEVEKLRFEEQLKQRGYSKSHSRFEDERGTPDIHVEVKPHIIVQTPTVVGQPKIEVSTPSVSEPPKPWYEFHWIKSFGKGLIAAFVMGILAFTIPWVYPIQITAITFLIVSFFSINQDPKYRYFRLATRIIGGFLTLSLLLPNIDSFVQIDNAFVKGVIKFSNDTNVILTALMIGLVGWLIWMDFKKNK
jgi:internalin A